MYLKFLGTGSAAELPVFGCDCPACTTAQVIQGKRRRSCSAEINVDKTTILIDAGLHDLHDRYKPHQIDAFLLTHYHMDHVQGLFRLRWGVADHIPVYGPPDENGCDDLFKHPGIFDFQPPFNRFETRSLYGIETTALPLNHSKPTFGYLFKSKSSKKQIAYLTDTSGLPDETLTFLQAINLDFMVIDCSHPPREQESKNHNNLNQVIQLIDKILPGKTYLTHISHELDTWLMNNNLPEGIEAAHDGLKIYI